MSSLSPPEGEAEKNSDTETASMFYKETRDHIKHEDALINNRMTWLVGLQAFLFGACGFSLSAQATIESARVLLLIAHDPIPGGRDALDGELLKTLTIISRARLGLALTGIGSALGLFVGILAAAFSMGSLVKAWIEKYPAESRTYPQIMGNIKMFKTVGKYAGLSPALTLPWLCIGVWTVLEDSVDLLKYVELATVLVIMLWVIIYYAFKLGRLVEAKT